MMITAFTIGTSRTINLGNFESLRIEASITVDVEVTDDSSDYKRATVAAQANLRELLEDTYRAQTKAKEKKIA